MKISSSGFVFTIALLTAQPAAAWERLTTEQQFRDRIVDRTIEAPNGSFVVGSDGQVAGALGGRSFQGPWQWHQGFWCRNVRVGNQESGTDCQVWEVNGNQIRMTRDQGRGETMTGTIR